MDNREMSLNKLVVGLGAFEDLWGPALRESGLKFERVDNVQEALKANADFLILDARRDHLRKEIESLKLNVNAPMLSLISAGLDRKALKDLKEQGSIGCVVDSTPPEEVALRIQWMLKDAKERSSGELRSSKRVWFQQKVQYKIFDQSHFAWSTTLSETGMFLRTGLSFPLYSLMHLSFSIPGDPQVFECDGVIVRQEVDHEPRGLGIMFQNLQGESIERLESFLEVYV